MANYIHVPDGAPVVPKFNVTVDEHDFRLGALRLIQQLRPSWKPKEVNMKVTRPPCPLLLHARARARIKGGSSLLLETTRPLEPRYIS